MATSGPGATNLTTGLVDALMDSIPIVAITGQVPQALIGRDAFQEADTFGITRAATKHNYLVKDIDELTQVDPRGVLHRQERPAGAGAGGRDEGRFTGQGPLHTRRTSCVRCVATSCGSTRTKPKIEEAVSFLWEAERPYIYAGGGVISSECGG